jgi:putative phosphoribosyl transferase
MGTNADAEGPGLSYRASMSRTGAVNSAVEPPLDLPDGSRRFADRRDAGRRLARLLGGLRELDPIVLGIPRGGVPVAAEVARALQAPLDVIVVRKIGAPMNPEYGIGALAEGGVQVVSARAVRALGIEPQELQSMVSRAEGELAQRLVRYRGERVPLPAEGRTAILVDDGLATGHTAQAAARSLRGRGATQVVLAVPVAAPRSVRELRADVDDVVCVEMPRDLWAIGFWYEDFSPTSDEEVAAALNELAAPPRR